MESQNLEYKKCLTEKFERAVVSFLNSRTGGIICIGKNDDGTVEGIGNTDSVQLEIADRIKNNVRPATLGLYDIVIEEENGKPYIKLIVSSGPEKPYYLKSLGMTSEGCFTRVGSRTEAMSRQMIETLFARRTRTSLRLIESPHQDLTFRQLKIYYEEHGKALNDQFAKTLDFLTPDGKYNLNAFLFADENSVTIKVAKYSGTDKIDLIENEEYGYCSILKAADKVLDKFEIENKTFTKITPRDRIEKKMFNPTAVREAVINAFVHNDYTDLMSPVFEFFSDRLEITSYGSLIEGMSVEELLAGCSRPRNREVMRIFRDMEKVEQLGSGMKRILSAYKSDIFKISPNFFRMAVYYEDTSEMSPENENVPLKTENVTLNVPLKTEDVTLNVTLNIPENTAEVLDEIRRNPKVTVQELGKIFSVTERTVKRHIAILKEAGLIERMVSRKTGYWKVTLPDESEKSEKEK